MEISLTLLMSVAVYPMGALAGGLMPALLGALGRRMHEDEDPREGAAWLVMAISLVAMGLALSVLPRMGEADVVQVSIGGWGGITVDRFGALGVVLVAVMGILAGAAMLPQLPGQSPPVASVLLACGCASLAFLAWDARQAMLCLLLTYVCLAVALGRGGTRAEARGAAVRYLAAVVPGLAAMGWAVLSSTGRAGFTDMSLIKQVIAGEIAENIAALRALTVGTALVLALPLVPFFAPDMLSRRPMGSCVAGYGIGTAAAAWLFVRCAYGMFPWVEGWEVARRGWVIPVLALLSAALMVAACIVRSPSALVGCALAGQGVWVPLAFATGGRSDAGFGVGVVLCVAVPLARVAALAVAGAGREPIRGRAESRAHRAAAIASAVALAGGALWLPGRFEGWWRLLAVVLLVVPSTYACYRLARFSVAERARRGSVYATVGSIAAFVALVAVVPTPWSRAVPRAVESDLKLHERFTVGPGGMPPPVNAPGPVPGQSK